LGWSIDLTAEHNDIVGCLAWEVHLTRSDAAPEGLTLAAWAHAIAARSSGLLEKLAVLEIDPTRDEALLRSDSPTRKGERAAYYELKLVGLAQATLKRFEANRVQGGPREQVAFAVTHEALTKLINDIVG
jgi:hypothetical protein